MLGGDLLLAKLASSGEARLGGHSRALVTAQRRAGASDSEMHVPKRKRGRRDGLPAARHSGPQPRRGG
jgi:hypothetical protein